MYSATTPYEPAPEVVVAPVAGLFPGAGASREWSSGLFDCFDDCYICCLTFWCPCITFGRTAEIVDRGTTSCGTSAALFALMDLLLAAWCTWAFTCMYHSRMCTQHGLPEAPCADFLVHLCCWPCTLCQEYRELKVCGSFHLFLKEMGGAKPLLKIK